MFFSENENNHVRFIIPSNIENHITMAISVQRIASGCFFYLIFFQNSEGLSPRALKRDMKGVLTELQHAMWPHLSKHGLKVTVCLKQQDHKLCKKQKSSPPQVCGFRSCPCKPKQFMTTWQSQRAAIENLLAFMSKICAHSSLLLSEY